MCDPSGPTTGNYKGFTWQVSWEKLPSHIRCSVQPAHCSLMRELYSGTQAPQPTMLLHISAFLTQAHPIGGLFIKDFPRHLCWDLLMRGRERNLEGISFYSTLTQDSVSTIFSFLPLFPIPPPSTLVHKMAGALCSGLPSVWIHLTLSGCCSMGKNGTIREPALFLG